MKYWLLQLILSSSKTKKVQLPHTHETRNKIDTNTTATVIHECYWKLSKINTNTIAKVIHECYWKLSKINTNTIAKVIHECYWKLLLLYSEAGDNSQAKKHDGYIKMWLYNTTATVIDDS